MGPGSKNGDEIPSPKKTLMSRVLGPSGRANADDDLYKH